MPKVKLYSARELDKKFPSGKWNDFEFIERRGNKAWWEYYGVPRFMYNKLARHYRQATVYNETSLLRMYTIHTRGLDGIQFPESFVKKVKP